MIREFIRRGVIVRTVINGLTFDGATKDPMQMAVRDALIGFIAATAQAQAEATKEAQRAGIEQAKASGESYRGRKPSYNREQLATVQDLLGQSANVIQIAKATNLSRQTVYRIKDDPAAAEAAFREAIIVAREQGARTFELLAALPLARLLRAANRPLEAHVVLASALEGFTPTPKLPAIAEAQAASTSTELPTPCASRILTDRV